ncbi:MAG: hypothetical protein M0Q92_14985 [Methanoregula sp.]|nr:hypothetical protein [Methanoregula sp.]
MTENNEKTTGWKDTGMAGPSPKESQEDENMAGAGGTGQENKELRWAQRHVPGVTGETAPGPAPQMVERKTELRGLGIGARREPKKTVRRRTERDLSTPDPEIPYAKTEKAVRDLVCSLMERQDRMNEAIFYKLNDLTYRLDDAEEDIRTMQEERGRK